MLNSYIACKARPRRHVNLFGDELGLNRHLPLLMFLIGPGSSCPCLLKRLDFLASLTDSLPERNSLRSQLVQVASSWVSLLCSPIDKVSVGTDSSLVWAFVCRPSSTRPSPSLVACSEPSDVCFRRGVELMQTSLLKKRFRARLPQLH